MNLLDSPSLLHNTNAMSFIITYSKPINDDILKIVIVSKDRENFLVANEYLHNDNNFLQTRGNGMEFRLGP
jgi:hypothetical protein